MLLRWQRCWLRAQAHAACRTSAAAHHRLAQQALPCRLPGLLCEAAPCHARGKLLQTDVLRAAGSPFVSEQPEGGWCSYCFLVALWL
jgi:hypothetical protein